MTITIDSTRTLRPISPLIYGLAHAETEQLAALGARLNRWGGNPNTRYNWVNGAWNAARDWEFRNYGDDAASPPGFASDRFVSDNQSVGVETVLTVPAMGWLARNADKQVQSVDVPADGGPPLSLDVDAMAGYDPADNRKHTSVPSYARKNAPFVDLPERGDGPVYQDESIHHLVQRFGSADQGGVRYYVVDNEPDLWSSTHTDVHPVRMSYDQMLATFVEYATAIKSVDPGANVVGPALSGWTSCFYSARDRGTDNYRTHADRQAHADMPFLPWWLDQVRRHDERIGYRTLDVLDVHYYPQAANVFSAADDPESRGLRMRSTRSLWDPTYIDESWINDKVRLIPRLREWIDQYYPGTRLAIGEWNWGGEQSTSGGLAVADVLGIFGREGVDLASYWTVPPPDSPAALAFALYRHFGDRAVAASVDASADYVTAYASRDSATGDVAAIAINKLDMDLRTTIHLTVTSGTTTESFVIRPGASAISDTGLVVGDGSDLHLVLPASSATLVRIKAP
ncbi:MAG TPA: glycoside hydrolase family 44 protein [Chloroflexota bacterium]|nr:glycoside hydrolase family 44 protein [Chloroflexota bacterium]